MNINERFAKIANADMATLAEIDAVLEGHKKEDMDTRTCTLTDAAKRCNLSRPTMRRLCNAGTIRTIKLTGVRRVVLDSLNEFILGR